MAKISFDFKNIGDSKNCAVSSSRIVNLEIEDESLSPTSESAFQHFLLFDQIAPDDVKNNSNLICGCDKQNDNSFLIHSQSSLSTSTCDDRRADKITDDSDTDFNLPELLNSADLKKAVGSDAINFKSKKNTSNDKMKIISSVEVGDDLSIFSSIAHEISEDQVDTTSDYHQRKTPQDNKIDLLDFNFESKECPDPLPSNNSLLKVEGNLSDLSSSLIIEDSDVFKGGILNSSTMCNSKVANESLTEKNPCVPNLSDLLSSIDFGDSNDNKDGSINRSNMSCMRDVESENESSLADLLSSIIIEDSDVVKGGNLNSSTMCNSKVANESLTEKNPCVLDLSDLLSSIDFGDSNDNKDGSINRCNMSCMRDAENENESSLADLLASTDINKPICDNEPSITNLSDILSSIDLGDSYDNKIGGDKQDNLHYTKGESCLAGMFLIDDINKSDNTVLKSKPLSFGSSNLCGKDANDTSDLLNDFLFDITSCSSSSNSYSSSCSEKENDSPKESLTENNLLKDKLMEYDSGYSSFDSLHKGFSFFDYSSGNNFFSNTVLNNKSDACKDVRKCKSEDAKNSDEEMSMSDLMTIVSPDFKSPILATSMELQGSINKDCSNMLDLIECLNTKSRNSDSHIISSCPVEYDGKLFSYDCVDCPISKNMQTGLKTVNLKTDRPLEKDMLIDRRDNDNNVASDDEQINIDLRKCIKSSKQQFTPKSPTKQLKNDENRSSNYFSSKICEDKSSSDSSQNSSNIFEFNNMVSRKKFKVNTKETLFSKALACKPKKDNLLLQKFDNIKNELLKNIIHRPVFIHCDVPQPIIETVQQSDKCILSNIGRKSFGLDVSCEFQ